MNVTREFLSSQLLLCCFGFVVLVWVFFHFQGILAYELLVKKEMLDEERIRKQLELGRRRQIPL